MKNTFTKLWAKLNGFFFFLFVTLPIYYKPVFAVTKTSEDFMAKFAMLIDEYKTELGIVLSIGVLLSIVIFIYHCVMLNAHANNPSKRAQDISNLLITGVCLAAQGSATIILGIIYYMFGA